MTTTYPSDMILLGILPCESDFSGTAQSYFRSDDNLSQAAKDLGASQDALIDILEHNETFFERLKAYKEVPTTGA